jgi:hypothetical protein
MRISPPQTAERPNNNVRKSVPGARIAIAQSNFT